MYAKCGALDKAKEVLDGLPIHDELSWNALITGYVQGHHSREALKCFELMQSDRHLPSAVTYMHVLKACGSIGALDQGEKVHFEINRQGLLNENGALGNALVDMYVKCGALAKAREVLDSFSVRNVVAWTALISGYTQRNNGQEALKCFEQMQHDGFTPNLVTYVCILKSCGSIGALNKGENVHLEIVRQGLLDANVTVAGALVDMYVKCGALAKAKEVLEGLSVRDVVSWSALIAGYVQWDLAKEALDTFEQMQQEGPSADATTFICVLKACGSIRALERAEFLYSEIIRRGLLSGNVALGGALVDMYIKCGAVSKGKQVLEELPVRDTISWSILIMGYVQTGHGPEAFNCFEQMKREGFIPDAVTLMCLLNACGNIGSLDMGKNIHSDLLRQGLLGSNVAMGNALVDMYAKCGELARAKEVLEALPVRDVVTWSTLIAGFVQDAKGKEALCCFERMKCDGFPPNAVTFVSILKACGSIGALDEGEKFHSQIEKQGLLFDNIALGNALLDMYAKCGALTEAKKVLEGLSIRNVVSFCTLIAGYVERGHCKEALNFFERMQVEGLSSNDVIFILILKACSITGALERGKSIHSEIARVGILDRNILLGGALVDMYAKCGAYGQAKLVLRDLPVCDVVSWSALIAGYAQGEHGKEALDCFECMQLQGLPPNDITFISILKACGSIGALDKGKHIHSEIDRQGLLEENVVLGNTLVDMYAKCGEFANAKEVLEGLSVRDVASWSSLIAGYVEAEHGKEALDCFKCMQREGLSPNAVTSVCILKACGSMGALDKGEMVHSEIIKQDLLIGNVVLGNALVDMYAKCGAVVKSREVLDGLTTQDVVSWSAVIAGYAQGESAKEALACFELMQLEGHYPDEITLLNVLSACSHSGLLDEGQKHFTRMRRDYGIPPDVEHHTCMVDLFGHTGLLDEAATVVYKMPFLADAPLWTAFLSACRKWGNMKLGRWAFENAIELEMLAVEHNYTCAAGAMKAS